MKYYSEITKRLYDDEKEAKIAETKELEAQKKKEAELKAKNDARATRAKEVETAYNEMIKSQENYKKILNDFVKDYGSFHFSTTKPIGLFDSLFNFGF